MRLRREVELPKVPWLILALPTIISLALLGATVLHLLWIGAQGHP